MYADDGIIFANSEQDIQLIKEEFGKIVQLNESKSRFLKFGGGLTSEKLKFCGLVYDFKNKSLMSSTRTGKSLEFSVSSQFLSMLSLNYSLSYSSISKFKDVSVKNFLKSSMYDFLILSPQGKLELFFNPKYMGYFLNVLYLGSFSFTIKEKNNFFEGRKDS